MYLDSLVGPADLVRHPYTSPFPNDRLVYTSAFQEIFSLQINILYPFNFTCPVRAESQTKLPAMPKN